MKKYRSIWISDIHLGITACRADELCKFLKENTCDQLYLVGDIIDWWKLRRSWGWPQNHTNVIRRLLTNAKRGTKIIYVIGNHDEFLRDWITFNLQIGNITIVNQCDHTGINGHRYLVTHGDMFDTVTQNYKLITTIGDLAYNLLLEINSILNKTRKWFGFGYWSFSRYIKRNTKRAINFIFKFEEYLARHAFNDGYHGVICGHIHMPEIKPLFGIVYFNDGCWVENCSAVVENWDGTFNLLIQGVDGEMHIEKTYDPFTGEIT